ncbi:MAG: LuxR C-terminal-related transcriptional regulator [Candidatus Sulfotelmatobacter sp.]
MSAASKRLNSEAPRAASSIRLARPADVAAIFRRRESQMHGAAARPGLMVVDTSSKVVGSNAEVVQILTFPEHPRNIHNLGAWLAKKVRSSLAQGGSASGLAKVQSARRTYLWRSFPLDLPENHGSHDNHNTGSGQSGKLTIVMMERKSHQSTTIAEIAQRFGLTAREQETVQFLREGFTSKEIAQRMNISPNTVKAFIRLVMVKMGASTRSGIVGMIVCPRP